MKYTVSSEENGLRIDKLIRRICPNISYSFLQKLFRTGKICINGKKVKADFHVSIGDLITNNLIEKIARPSLKNQELSSRLQSMIIFEDDNILAINKPSGLAVQLGTKIKICIETMVKSYNASSYLVHRLDKDTSGILLVAKNRHTAKNLSELFKTGKIKKTYWALVDGKIDKTGTIDNYIGKSFVSGEEKMVVVKNLKGQRAITNYNPITRIEYYTLLEMKPLTGRKHQLRVHCSEVLGAPILGDVKYNKNVQHNHLFLHAKKIEIPSLNISIEAQLPDYFNKFLECKKEKS